MFDIKIGEYLDSNRGHLVSEAMLFQLSLNHCPELCHCFNAIFGTIFVCVHLHLA